MTRTFTIFPTTCADISATDYDCSEKNVELGLNADKLEATVWLREHELELMKKAADEEQ